MISISRHDPEAVMEHTARCTAVVGAPVRRRVTAYREVRTARSQQ